MLILKSNNYGLNQNKDKYCNAGGGGWDRHYGDEDY